jgi:hypothetical protein
MQVNGQEADNNEYENHAGNNDDVSFHKNKGTLKIKNRKIGTLPIFVFDSDHRYPIRIEFLKDATAAKMGSVPNFMSLF